MSGLLDGRVVIVTGASRSIGAASALAFADAGASVVLAARTADRLSALAAEITGRGGKALAVPTDVTDPAAMEQLVEKTVATFGRLDAAFNNAGANQFPRPLADIPFEDFEAGIKSNLYSVFLGMRFQIPAMLATGGGAIVNMSSSAGLVGVAGMSPYSAAKHGVVALTKSAALDYGRRNIRVNALAPGPIENEFMAANLNDERRQLISARIPLGRLGATDEVARAAVWLCSDEASFITGAVLSVDGGRLAGG